MKNANHLLMAAHLFTRLFIRFPHLMTARNALDHINIIFSPQGEGIFCLALRADSASDKTFTHNGSSNSTGQAQNAAARMVN
ncbi:hypothetical protein BEI72_08980 [Erwinia amylovora]|nr:hypothetical protein BEI72_08980 [Erwinia amylovora]